MKLFYFYIGGRTQTSLVELHDVRFAIAEKLEDTFDSLRKSWWGVPESLHLDCWGELVSADGHDVILRPAPAAEGADKLWFVNLGGYQPGMFSELHENVFAIAPTETKARAKALKNILHWRGHHMDNQYEVENIHDVSAQLGGNWHIHLEKTDTPKPFEFELGYWMIGRADMKKSTIKQS